MKKTPPTFNLGVQVFSGFLGFGFFRAKPVIKLNPPHNNCNPNASPLLAKFSEDGSEL